MPSKNPTKAEAEAKAEATPPSAGGAVTVTAEQLNALVAEQVDKRMAEHRDRLGQVAGDGAPTRRGQAEIEAWLDSELPEDLVFCESWEMYLTPIAARERYDREKDLHETIPGVEISPTRWTGVGAEIRDAKGVPIFPWGVVYLSQLSEVRSGRFTLDEVREALQKTRYWEDGKVFSGSFGQERLRAYYSEIWARQASEQRLEALRRAQVPGREKSGSVLVA